LEKNVKKKDVEINIKMDKHEEKMKKKKNGENGQIGQK